MITAFSWMHLLILAAALAVVAAVILLALRGWRRRGIDAVIGVTLTGSALVAAFSLLGAVFSMVSAFADASLTATVPTQQFWPALPDGVTVTDGPTATLDGGGFTQATLTGTGFSAGARALYGTGAALDALVPATVAALIAYACFRLIRGRAFSRTLTTLATVTAVVVLVGGIAASVVNDIAASMMSSELLSVTAMSAKNVGDTDLMSLLPQPGVSVVFPFWPIGIGFALMALAAILRHGFTLQRDTEGLV